MATDVLAAMLQADLQDEALIVAALISALDKISSAADHHHTGCPPGPMQRMPANLRAAIIDARAALALVRP